MIWAMKIHGIILNRLWISFEIKFHAWNKCLFLNFLQISKICLIMHQPNQTKRQMFPWNKWNDENTRWCHCCELEFEMMNLVKTSNAKTALSNPIFVSESNFSFSIILESLQRIFKKNKNCLIGEMLKWSSINYTKL